MKLQLKLGQKLLAVIVGMLVVSIAAVALISVSQSKKYLSEQGQQDLAHLASMAAHMCELNSDMALEKVSANLKTGRALFDDFGGSDVEVVDGKMYLTKDGNRFAINDDTAFVDEVMVLTDGPATIFMKDGAGAIRIATSVRDTDGRRVVGTRISQEVYDQVIRDGKQYVGRAWVVDRWFVTAYEPIRDIQGAIVGSYCTGVPEQNDLLREALLQQKIGATGYIYAIDSKGVLKVHPAKEGENISKYDFIKEMIANGPNLAEDEIATIIYPWVNSELGETDARDKIVAYTYFKEWDWIIGAGSYLDEFTAPAKQVQNAILLLGLICLGISTFLGYVLARSITRPIIKLSQVAGEVASGDVSRTITITSKDEVGVLAGSFNSMIEYLQSAAKAAERIANNDLTVSIEPRSSKDVFGQSFKRMVANLSSMIKQLSANAQELVSAATEIASTSEQMSRGSRDQSDQVDQVSSAVEEMSAAIIQSSQNASLMNETSRSASENAMKGGEVVSQTIIGMQRITDTVRESADTIARLEESADRIGEIITVIDDIADQTNLLALNAAIEAARAGEQGRGFAVVADEVRKLAERTGQATAEITDMIKNVQGQTKNAVGSMEAGIKEVNSGRDLADQAGNSLSEIVRMNQEVLTMVQQIAASTEQQSTASEAISANLGHISQVTKETAKGAEQAATAAEELNRQAESLNKMVANFKIN
jgi:methyl-accepting chemotaxis protein